MGYNSKKLSINIYTNCSIIGLTPKNHISLSSLIAAYLKLLIHLVYTWHLRMAQKMKLYWYNVQ